MFLPLEIYATLEYVGMGGEGEMHIILKKRSIFHLEAFIKLLQLLIKSEVSVTIDKRGIGIDNTRKIES